MLKIVDGGITAAGLTDGPVDDIIYNLGDAFGNVKTVRSIGRCDRLPLSSGFCLLVPKECTETYSYV